MKKIAVGSENPVKIYEVKQGFERVWPEKTWEVSGIAVGSDVSDQPMSDAESILGARNRAQKAREQQGADFGVGLEGGVAEIGGKWFDSGWVVVVDREGNEGLGSTVRMLVPGEMMKLLREGKELGDVDDLFFKKRNSKQESGHFGLMTNDHLTRTHCFTDGVISALALFIHPYLND